VESTDGHSERSEESPGFFAALRMTSTTDDRRLMTDE
jgi:hypothetical protein